MRNLPFRERLREVSPTLSEPQIETVWQIFLAMRDDAIVEISPSGEIVYTPLSNRGERVFGSLDFTTRK